MAFWLGGWDVRCTPPCSTHPGSSMRLEELDLPAWPELMPSPDAQYVFLITTCLVYNLVWTSASATHTSSDVGAVACGGLDGLASRPQGALLLPVPVFQGQGELGPPNCSDNVDSMLVCGWLRYKSGCVIACIVSRPVSCLGG